MTNATLAEQSIPCVAADLQNALSVQVSIQNVSVSEPKPYIAPYTNEFAQGLVSVICGKLGEHGFMPVEPVEVFSRKQHQAVAKVRHLATYIMRNLGASTPQIGDIFDRDHTTIISSYRRAEMWLEYPKCESIHRRPFRRLYLSVCEELERRKLAEVSREH